MPLWLYYLVVYMLLYKQKMTNFITLLQRVMYTCLLYDVLLTARYQVADLEHCALVCAGTQNRDEQMPFQLPEVSQVLSVGSLLWCELLSGANLLGAQCQPTLIKKETKNMLDNYIFLITQLYDFLSHIRNFITMYVVLVFCIKIDSGSQYQ